MINPNHLINLSTIVNEIKIIHFNKVSQLNQYLLTEPNPTKVYQLITEITKLEQIIYGLENIIKLIEK